MYGPFEVNYVLREYHTIAEVQNGIGNIFSTFSVRNANGSPRSFLRIEFRLPHSKPIVDVIRNVDVGAFATQEDVARILRTFRLPEELAPDRYEAELLFIFMDELTHRDVAVHVPLNFTLLPANYIPTDFARAHLLAGYMHDSAELRNFASEAVAPCLDLPLSLQPAAALRCIYNALLRRQLHYQNVPLPQYPNCQFLSPYTNTLSFGGSCMELSLLFAALLKNVGYAPILLHLPGHIAAGCIAAVDAVPETLDDPKCMLTLLDSGVLHLVETTAVTAEVQGTYDIARKTIRSRIEQKSACRLINLCACLRNGHARLLPEPRIIAVCPGCGYDHFTSMPADSDVCPACGKPFRQRQADIPEVIPDYCTALRYAATSSGVTVTGISDRTITCIAIPPIWNGKPVQSISSRAFERSGATQILLPSTITAIGSRAFAECKSLEQITLPDSLQRLDSQAFAGSGLRTVHIPSGVKLVSSQAFAHCRNLCSVSISNGVEQIDGSAFANCNALRAADIPSSVHRISATAFPNGCKVALHGINTVVL